MNFCGPQRQEHRNASTEIFEFPCSDQFLCSRNDCPHNGWPKGGYNERYSLIGNMRVNNTCERVYSQGTYLVIPYFCSTHLFRELLWLVNCTVKCTRVCQVLYDVSVIIYRFYIIFVCSLY